jgi:hypothetical protein
MVFTQRQFNREIRSEDAACRDCSYPLDRFKSPSFMQQPDRPEMEERSSEATSGERQTDANLL